MLSTGLRKTGTGERQPNKNNAETQRTLRLMEKTNVRNTSVPTHVKDAPPRQ